MDSPIFFRVRGSQDFPPTQKDPLNSKNSGLVGCLILGAADAANRFHRVELKTPQVPLVIFDPNWKTPFEMDYINGFL